MTVLILALVAGLFVLGGVLGAAAYGLTALVGLVWRAAVPRRTPGPEQTPHGARHVVVPTSAH